VKLATKKPLNTKWLKEMLLVVLVAKNTITESIATNTN
jgi:hypothetical protein